MPITCQGEMDCNHDATMCQSCWHINQFYTIFQPALARLKKLNNCSVSSDDYEVCGILTFLELCFQFGFITNDAKSDISSHGNPPDSFDYTPLLDSIVNAKKKFISRPSYSVSIRALLYKNKKKTETKLSVMKPDFEDCFKDCTSALPCKDEKIATEINERKRRVSKRYLDKCVKGPTPASLNKQKRKERKINEAKLSAPKRHLDKRLKPSTPASLLNKHKNKTPKTNKPKRSLKKNRFEDCLNDPTSSAGKTKNKASMPKSKKVADKIPTKGTLKRKRWFLKQMETEENYEDDVFENRPLYRLAKFDESSQSSSDYSNRCGTPTWDFKLSPRPESPLPIFDDCDNIAQLKMFRKDAEEYQHLRKKRRMNLNCSIIEPPSKPPIEVKVENQAIDEARPSCSYANLTTPLKDDDYDSDEVPDDYP